MKKNSQSLCFYGTLFLLTFYFCPVVTSQAYADGLGSVSQEDPVDFTADQLEHDDKTQIITATGNVELVQSGRILRADRVVYDLTQDRVTAAGNVILNEVNGDTYFAENVEFTDKMKDGFVTGLRGLLADGSRFTATEGERIEGVKIVMRDATYTPCEPCEDNPDAPPVWQIVADKVTHHDEENRISYKNARFELGGVPIAYTPYFSHPDGSVDRKSGFLAPSAGFDSQLGAFYQQDYYWNIAPDKDATIGIIAATQEAPLLITEYRQRFNNAYFEIESGGTYSERTDSEAGQDVDQDEEFRGHVFANARWDINNKWRSGLAVNIVSDEQYLNQYDLSNEDVLENELYIERFSGRNYAVGRLLGFQDVRISERKQDQPAVLPELYAGFIGEPNALLGGRWSFEASALGLYRDGNAQDLNRGSLELGWQRRDVSDIGLVSKLDLTLRGDAYHVTDRDIAPIGSSRDDDSSELRGFGLANWEISYPFARSFENMQMTIEPIASITGVNNVEVDGDVPNEDSQDVVIDALNLFEENRFPGFDRIEDRSHATYGLRAGIHGYNGYRGEIFFGQSYRFNDDDNPFPDGSGLSEDSSDYVGQVTAQLDSYLNLNYRFQLNNTNFSSERHEADLTFNVGRLNFGSRYFYTDSLEGTDIDASREQIRNWARLKLTENWGIHGSLRYDFSDENEGLRNASYGIDYTSQCFNISATANRSLTRDSSGDSSTDIIFRIGLKNLGEFQASGLSLSDSNE